MLWGKYIWCPCSVIYKWSTFNIVKGFDTSLRAAEDYDLYLRITRDSPVFCLNQFVADYRLHGSSMSTDYSLMLRETLKVLRSQWDFVKESNYHTEAFRAGRKHWQEHYGSLQMGDQILEVAEASLPSSATVAVATDGKRELLRLGSRRAWHFPQAEKGSVSIPWIQAGMRYDFTLFGGPNCAKELAAISVTGLVDADPGSNVDPIPSGQAYLIAVPNPV